MDTFKFIDIYATKGIEYLIVIGFLVSIVAFYRYFVSPSKAMTTEHQGFFEALSAKFMKPYLGEMRWNPVMSYMKRPNSETDEAKRDSKEQSGQ